MNNETPVLSDGFRRWYCDAAALEVFSAWHPVGFQRVQPVQARRTPDQ